MPGLLSTTDRNAVPSDAEDRGSIISRTNSPRATPDTITKLIRRLRGLTLNLLPVQVDPKQVQEPTSRVITPQVVSAYKAAAGDFLEALPYCLLRARAEFIWDANHDPADYDENLGRAIACEVLARRIVHHAEPSRLNDIMSTRYQHFQVDGDLSEMSSVLELAIDQHCTIFLSSSECQNVVNDLWNGDIVQKNNEHHDIDYIRYSEIRDNTFWGHLDVSRLSVPRYQNVFRIMIWFFFLGVYSQAVREPLEKSQDLHWDGWEVILYVMALSFTIEDVHKFFSLLRFATWRTVSFWNIVSFTTDGLLVAAFILRVIGLRAGNSEEQVSFRLKSFQVLSFVAPFIWMKLVRVFDGYKYIGTMQICVGRMLKESGIFFALLSVLALGFAQGLFALDAADGTIEHPADVFNALIQGLLQAPNYEKYSESTPGLLLYYLWNAVTAIVLLNVLISLFSSAYSDVVEDAEAHYLAFFASKTVGMIRAPDSYVYPAPFNLIEGFLVAPFELLPFFHLSKKNYATLNRYVMGVLFFIPLTVIAFYESTLGRKDDAWLNNWFRGNDEGSEDTPAHRNPVVTEDPEGRQISRVPFEELIKVFPSTTQSSEATILAEIDALKKQIELLARALETQRT